MRLLFVACNPEDAGDLGVDEEIRQIEKRLASNAGIEPITAEFHRYLPIGEIAPTISAFDPDVLHLTAHGMIDGVALRNPVGGASILHGDQLATILAALTIKPKLIVLNACSSGAMARTLASSDAADHVLGTDAPITNVGAITMAYTMYEWLAQGHSLHAACDIARTKLELVDKEQVFAKLHHSSNALLAEDLRFVETPQVLARLPKVDRWLALDLRSPQPDFDTNLPEVMVGAASLSNDECSLLFRITDQKVSVVGVGERDADEGWKKVGRATDGKVWLDRTFQCFGDANFSVQILTSDGRQFGAIGRISDVLEKLYLMRKSAPLPAAIQKVVEAVIDNLRK